MKKQIVVRTDKFGNSGLINRLNEGYTIIASNSFEYGIEYVLGKEVEDMPENVGKEEKWYVTIGRRDDDGIDLECSGCGYSIGMVSKRRVNKKNVNYCSCCGAKMKNAENIATF